MLFQPSNIIPDEVSGSGCIDVGVDCAVSWRVNGTSAMTAYQIDFFQNNAQSTFVLSTGKQPLAYPFWGVNYKGVAQSFSAVITSAAMTGAGMVNGGEYKLRITQWCAGLDTGVQADVTDTLATGNYFFTLAAGSYVNFNLSTPLNSGDQLGYSTLYGVVWTIHNNVFQVQTGTLSTSSTGTSISTTAYSEGEEWVMQTTDSVFITRTTPTVTFPEMPSPLTTNSYSFTATYSQAQGDAIKWVRWQLAEVGAESTPLVDTGEIAGTGQLQLDYDGFFTGTRYSRICTVETVNGMQATTGWESFLVTYSVSPMTGVATACQSPGRNCVQVEWQSVDGADSYDIYRRIVGKNALEKIASVSADYAQARDFGAKSGTAYIYSVWPVGNGIYITDPMRTQEITPQYGMWSIAAAQLNENGEYHILKTYLFRFGAGGISLGAMSNNNAPTLLQNFTRYPNRQASSANYLTGSVSGYVGQIESGTKTYADTTQEALSVMELSTAGYALFLTDPKGYFLAIETGGATTANINPASPALPQTVALQWAEIQSTEGLTLVSTPDDPAYGRDNIYLTTLNLDPETGNLVWTTPNDYTGGSVLSIDENGDLVQTTDGTFTPAVITIYYDNGQVVAVT